MVYFKRFNGKHCIPNTLNPIPISDSGVIQFKLSKNMSQAYIFKYFCLFHPKKPDMFKIPPPKMF